MPRDPQVLIFVGIKDAVIALDDRTGAEVWRAELRASDFVTVLWDGEALLAANGLASLASSRHPSTTSDTDLAAEKRRREAAAAAAS